MFITKFRFPFIFYFCLVIFSGTFLDAQSTFLIKGIVLDKKSKELLPYASISIKNFSIGTITNEVGEFDFYIPGNAKDDTLVVAFIGYETSMIPLQSIKGELKIRLEPAAIAIDEVYVYPLSPEEYIKRAMKKVDENYAMNAYQTQAYFSEEVKENGLFITAYEAIFKSFYPQAGDTTKNQHQLLLYRAPDKMHEFSFMKEWRDRQEKKEKKKAEKKGEKNEVDADDDKMINLGGPETLLHFNIRNQSDAFLDSNNFKRFAYLFGESKFYQGKKLMLIHFEAKRALDNFKESGNILMDPETYAIVSIESKGEVTIPIAVKPILFALGIQVKEPVFNRSIKYEQYKGSYYPKDFHWNASVKLFKKHLFKIPEYSHIEAGQILFINKIITNDASPIPEEKVFDVGKKMEEQVHTDGNISWEGMNILKD